MAESAQKKDSERIESIHEKLASTEKQLRSFEDMSVWERFRFLLGR